MPDNLLINRQGLTEEQFLAAYDASKYERPSVTVDMLIFTVTDEEKENYRKLPEKVLRLLIVNFQIKLGSFSHIVTGSNGPFLSN